METQIYSAADISNATAEQTWISKVFSKQTPEAVFFFSFCLSWCHANFQHLSLKHGNGGTVHKYENNKTGQNSVFFCIFTATRSGTILAKNFLILCYQPNSSLKLITISEKFFPNRSSLMMDSWTQGLTMQWFVNPYPGNNRWHQSHLWLYEKIHRTICSFHLPRKAHEELLCVVTCLQHAGRMEKPVSVQHCSIQLLHTG